MEKVIAWPTHENLCDSTQIFLENDKRRVIENNSSQHAMIKEFSHEIKKYVKTLQNLFFKTRHCEKIMSSLLHHYDATTIENNGDISPQLCNAFSHATLIE